MLLTLEATLKDERLQGVTETLAVERAPPREGASSKMRADHDAAPTRPSR